ncbi:MAG: hypothetical protein JO252_20710, partial [Planctomycetaceae bacterium]|nr:hypothetical protein [Planctomycetaceae bacterium]
MRGSEDERISARALAAERWGNCHQTAADRIRIGVGSITAAATAAAVATTAAAAIAAAAAAVAATTAATATVAATAATAAVSTATTILARTRLVDCQ